ncbi:MAG: hypothetical protein CME71_07015 [Halobacteriovorax sp.]|nr:hypothetical protein [Halobacteriovorax sp.]
MDQRFIAAIEHLSEYGWYSSNDFFEPELLEDLRSTLLSLRDSDAFEPAKIGKGSKKKRIPEVRGDWIRWLSEIGDFPATKAYLAQVDEFRLALNQNVFLGASEYEAHFAIYPSNTFYKKHLDRHRDTPHRILTTTLYLNKDYSPEQGGQLEIEDLKQNKIATVLPNWGTFVCFSSAEFPHQVLPTKVERYSLTGWMRSS